MELAGPSVGGNSAIPVWPINDESSALQTISILPHREQVLLPSCDQLLR